MRSKLSYYSLVVFFIFASTIIIGCSNNGVPIYVAKNKDNNLTKKNEFNTSKSIIKKDNISLELNTYVDKIFSNVDLSEDIQQYHFENILIFANFYSSIYNKNFSQKFNDFLYTDFTKRRNQIFENLKNDGKRLDKLQFLYLYSQNIKNHLENSNFLNKIILEEYSEEYMFLVENIILPFWYDYPAWHCKCKHPQKLHIKYGIITNDKNI